MPHVHDSGRDDDHEQGPTNADRKSHDHSAHGHTHDATEKRLAIALAILGTFTVVEAVGGYFANSIALLAEAAHMLADSASLVLAILAIRMSRRPADTQRTYGHRRYQPLAAFVNGLALLLLTAWVVYEAVLRLVQRPEVDGRLMLIIAVIGGVANLIAVLALSGAQSLNERGARAHVMSDLLGSAAATAAAILILTAGWTIADPLLSLFVSVLIFRSGWALTRESANVLLESAPPGFNVKRIEAELIEGVPSVVGVHHVHVWTMTGEKPMVTLHADLTPGADRRSALTAIHTLLLKRLDIEHVTVQIEEEGQCDTPDCLPKS